MKKKLSKQELALKKIASAQQAYVNDHIADIENPHGVTKTQIGLGNVTNDAQVKRTEMGVANGVATLGASGIVPDAQLPNYKDVIEGYLDDGDFYTAERSDDYKEIGGIRWATKNIGAESETDTGLYFQWGDTLGYTGDQCGSQKSFSWADYKYCNGTDSVMTKYNDTDGKTVLDSDDDAAKEILGRNWRMPTAEEFAALIEASTYKWTDDYDGCCGYFFISKTDDEHSLFFPAAGYCYENIFDFEALYGAYWSSSLDTADNKYAYELNFSSSNLDQQAHFSRCSGRTIRPIYIGPTPIFIPAEKGKIYIDKKTKQPYIWNGNYYEKFIGESLVNIQYHTLKALRDNSQLVPGTQYRIIDYYCTTIQEDTRSAGNSFNIIVTADNEYTLNENARAVRQEGDEYYANNNSNLTAWQLRYTLDNVKWSERPYTKITQTNPSEDWYFISTDKIVEYNGTQYRLWLGSYEFTRGNGKYAASVLNYSSGTDLYLYDEETEEVYTEDIVGKIDTITNYYGEGKGTILWMKDEFGNECPYDFKNIQFKRWKAYDTRQGRRLQDRYVSAGSHRNPSGITNQNDSDFIWAYTFSNTSSGSTIEDYSLNPKNNKYFGSYGNIIKENTDDYLNNIVIYNRSYCNYFGCDCQYITIADYSSGDYSYNNIFEGENRRIILGRNCSDNCFKNRASYSMVRGGRNIIGETCTDILLYETSGNRIGENGTDIKILVDCNDNIIGSHCSTIELSAMAEGNRIGDYCSNIWGRFIGTTIGNYCNNIHTEDNRICAYSKIESGNSNLILTTNSGTTSTLYNIIIAPGVNSSSDSDKTITHVASNSTQTVYRPIGSQDIYI